MEVLEEVAEAEVLAAADREHWAKCLTNDAACLPFGMVGEPRRKLGPITTLVLLLSMGVDLMDIRVSAVFPSSRQRAAFPGIHRPAREPQMIADCIAAPDPSRQDDGLMDTDAAVRARRGSLQETLRASSLHRSVHPATSALFVLSCLANGTPPFCSPAAGPLASVR